MRSRCFAPLSQLSPPAPCAAWLGLGLGRYRLREMKCGVSAVKRRTPAEAGPGVITQSATTLPRTFGNCEDCDRSTWRLKEMSAQTLRTVIWAPANKARRVGATWKTQLIRMAASRTLLLLGLAAPAAAFGVSARGLSPAKTSVRSPSPQLVLGRVKSFVSNRIVSPFKKGSEEEDGEQKAAEVLAGESMIADAASLEIPPPMPALDKKNISAVDAFLVRLGMKTEDECTIPEEGENLMEQIKCAGRAGIISYILWEWACERSPLSPVPLALAPPPRSNLPPLPPLSAGPRAAVRWLPSPTRCRSSRTVWIGAGGIACFAYYQAAGGLG